jgi:uncharacterized NAD(P)/FAD-binding protein YdhS
LKGAFDYFNFNIAPSNAYDRLEKLVEEKRHKIREEISARHRKKLSRLGVTVPPDDRHVNKKPRSGEQLAKPITNLSSKKLDDITSKTLSKGLRYGVQASKVNRFEILARFWIEAFAQSFDEEQITDQTDEHMANMDNKTAFISGLQNFTKEFLDMSERAHDNLSREERSALVALSKDKSIIVSKADKGDAVVIQNARD